MNATHTRHYKRIILGTHGLILLQTHGISLIMLAVRFRYYAEVRTHARSYSRHSVTRYSTTLLLFICKYKLKNKCLSSGI
jgi:hypothetical protein